MIPHWDGTPLGPTHDIGRSELFVTYSNMLTVTKYSGLGSIVAYSEDADTKSSLSVEGQRAESYISLWIDNSSSMESSIAFSGPLLVKFLHETYSVIGSFDVDVFMFSTTTKHLGQYNVISKSSLDALTSAIRTSWHPHGSTNPCGAMCMGLREMAKWCVAHPTGTTSILTTTDGEFNSVLKHSEVFERGLSYDHEYTPETFPRAMAAQIRSVNPSTGLHFIGLNKGLGGEQLARLAADPSFDRRPMLHEFGEDTNVHDVVKHMFPTACGALRLKVMTDDPSSFDHVNVTLQSGASECVPFTNCLLVDVESGETLVFNSVDGEVDEAIQTAFRTAERNRAFHAELDASLRPGHADKSEAFSILSKYGDLRVAGLMRAASSSAKGRGAADHEIFANLRAVSSQSTQ